MAALESELARVTGPGAQPGHRRMSRITESESQQWIA